MGCEKKQLQHGEIGDKMDSMNVFDNGACTKDDLWVNFSGVRYEDFHPRALYTDGKEKRKLLRLM